MSHFNQRMTIHSKDEAVMCKVFPSSLGPMAMRWFDGLRADSIGSFKELTRAFGSHFITFNRVLQPLDSLLSLSMREGKTLKTYSDRYWEMYNEIKGDFEDCHQYFQEWPPNRTWFKEVPNRKACHQPTPTHGHVDKYKRVEED